MTQVLMGTYNVKTEKYIVIFRYLLNVSQTQDNSLAVEFWFQGHYKMYSFKFRLTKKVTQWFLDS